MKIKKILRKLDRRKLPLVYVDAAGEVTISRKLYKDRVNQVRGIMITSEIEWEVDADPFMKYQEAMDKAKVYNAELLSVELCDIYSQNLKAFNSRIFELIDAGHKKCTCLSHYDPVWCQEAVDEEFAWSFEMTSNYIEPLKIFRYVPTWCRIQHRH